MSSRRDALLLGGLCLLAFVVLLYHACGVLAPYRDTGEFVTAVRYLNIPHPTGYSTYTLLARVWAEIFPWGSWAYRLNILSAFCSALSLILGIILLRRHYGVSFPAAFVSMVLLIFSNPLLGLSLVSEMYSAALVFLLLILLCLHERLLFLTSFLAGLALGVRMDLALSAVYALPFVSGFWREASGRRVRLLSLCLFSGILGASIFLYLPLRSATVPLINWADPSNWEGFWRSVTRASYGSAVDLLSQSYAKGALFWDDLVFWLSCAWRNFGPLLLVAPLGVFHLSRQKKLMPGAFAWLANVPIFLFLANMPLNPHAAKIVEDHFIPGFLILTIWMAVGLEFILSKINSVTLVKTGVQAQTWIPAFAGMTLISVVSIIAFHRASAWSMRANFYVVDYARNLFASSSKNSILVLHEDVQLFGSWEAQRVRGKRADIAIVGQGLSGTAWYQENLRRRWGFPDLFLGDKLGESEAWEAFLRFNSRPVFAGYETDIPAVSFSYQPSGLTRNFCRGECRKEDNAWVWEILALRGGFRYEEERLFFNQDLIDDYARALDSQGWAELRAGRAESARRFWKRALMMKPRFPFPYSGLGHAAFAESDWEGARRYWRRSCENFLHLLELSKRYKSLPGVSAAINIDLAQNLVSLGVASDRLGRLEESLSFYQDAALRDPGNIQAHYNMAASYWRLGQRELSRLSFERVLQLDPGHVLARKYLTQMGR